MYTHHSCEGATVTVLPSTAQQIIKINHYTFPFLRTAVQLQTHKLQYTEVQQ